MCGRYYLTTPPAQLAIRFGLESTEGYEPPGENVCPTTSVPAILSESPHALSTVKWGLIPSWAKEAKVGGRMFNARCETVAETAAFRAAFKRRRCLIPADGFYEWCKDPDGKKHPVRFAMPDGEPFAFAGLWEVWRPPHGGEPVRSCTIITTQANDLLRPIHDRMPVILPREAEQLWLDTTEDPSYALGLLVPYTAEMLSADLPRDYLTALRSGQLSLDTA